MNNRAFTISLGLAILAVFMVYTYIKSMEEDIRSKWGTDVAVLVAKKDIDEMDEIREDMLVEQNRPKKFLEPGRVTDKSEVVNFIAAVPIRKGEQITYNKVIAPGIKTGLARQITPGKRAISISVTDDSGVNKLIKPGDRIDILASVEPPGAARGAMVTKVVLQDVPVLAVGDFITAEAPRKTEKDQISGKERVRKLNYEKNFSSIAVEVDPQLATQIVLLKDASARITVMLRNNDDTERVNIGPLTLPDVLNGLDPKRGVATQR